jgi:hypothetical protein
MLDSPLLLPKEGAGDGMCCCAAKQLAAPVTLLGPSFFSYIHKKSQRTEYFI